MKINIPSSFKKAFTLLLFFALAIGSVFAQSGHYWTQQYGTRSMLLGGSVIGGVSDLGAVYYNPARISQSDNLAFMISADVYELNNLTIEDAYGNNKNASSSDFGGVPSLAAGSLKVPFLKNHNFAWLILNRMNSDLGFNYKNEVYDNVLENFPGEEYLGAEFALTQRAKEEWMGLSWSYAITEKLSVGASGYLSIINQKKGSKINLQALSESNQVAMYRFNKNFSFDHYSVLFKAGLAYQTPTFVLGLTVLTSAIPLKGEGSFQNEDFFAGIEGITTMADRYTTSYQKNLNTAYKSPWSIGVGLSYNVKSSFIHFSAEWYSAIPKYTLMEAEEYSSQSTGETFNFSLVDELNQVINAGLGLEIYLNDKISLYGSANTDFSAVTSDISRFAENKAETANSVFKADFYHFGGGFVLSMNRADVTLGATYTGAHQDFTRPFNFPDDPDDSILDSQETATLNWSRWRFVFSFSLPILKDIQKKVEKKLGF